MVVTSERVETGWDKGKGHKELQRLFFLKAER